MPEIDLSGIPKEIDLSGIPADSSIDLSGIPEDTSGGVDLSGIPYRSLTAEDIPEIVNQLKASLTTGAEFTPQQMEAYKEPTPVSDKFRSMGGAVGEMISSAGGLASAAGALTQKAYGEDDKIAQFERSVGQSVTDYGKKMAEYYKVQDPTFADKLAGAVASGAVFLIPGIGVMRGAGVLTQTPRIAALIASGASGTFEAGLEAGGVYNTMISKGASEAEALKAASGTFAANAALNTGLNYGGGVMGKLLPGVKTGTLKQVAASGAKASGAEALQEGTQTAISNVATSEPAMQGVGESAIIGAIVGGATSGVADVANKIAQPTFAPEPVAAQEGSIGAKVAKPVETPATVNAEPSTPTGYSQTTPARISKAEAKSRYEKVGEIEKKKREGILSLASKKYEEMRITEGEEAARKYYDEQDTNSFIEFSKARQKAEAEYRKAEDLGWVKEDGADPIEAVGEKSPVSLSELQNKARTAKEAYDSLKARATTYPTKNTIKDRDLALSEKIKTDNALSDFVSKNMTEEFVPRDYMGDDRLVFRVGDEKVGDSLFSIQRLPKNTLVFENFPELMGKKVGYSNLVGVESKFQGTGIGTEILKRIEGRAAKEGADYFIFTSVLKPAVSFYEKNGYKYDPLKRIAVKKISATESFPSPLPVAKEGVEVVPITEAKAPAPVDNFNTDLVDGKIVMRGPKSAPISEPLTPAVEPPKGEIKKIDKLRETKIVDEGGVPLRVYHGTTAPEPFTKFGEYEATGDEEIIRTGSGGDPRSFLGHHFAKEPEVADKFAKGLYGEREFTKGAGGRVIPAFLDIKNPFKTSDSEMLDEMLKGDYSSSEVENQLNITADANGIDPDEIFQKYTSNENFRKEINQKALRAEEQYDEPSFELAHEMSSKFKSDLEAKGHDGIIYKNEIEGGTSYIAFSGEQVINGVGGLGKKLSAKTEAPTIETPPPPPPPTAEATPPAPPTKPLSEDGASGSPKQRGFLRTVENSGGTTQGLKEQVLKIDPQEYSQLPNADVLKAADATIAKKGTVRALKDLMATENPSIEDTGVAIRLMKIYEGREDYDKVIPLVDKFDSVFRKSGRTIQLASLWNSLSPSGFVKTIDRSLGKMKVTLDEPFKQMLIKNMSKIKAMPDGPEKSKATFSLLNSVYDKIPFGAKFSNLIDAYRYSNMLSSPLTHERNLYGNTLQTFVTKPLDMIGDWGYGLIKHPFNPIARDIQLMDIPKYYQAVFKTIPEASTAFLDSITSNKVSSKIVESPNEVNFVSEAMRERLPKALKIIPGIMEATDRFFSVMIASGEKARLMKKGLSESAAELQAKNLAEKILYRQKLGEVKKGDVPLLTKALDELGSLVLSARNRPVIGKPISWFAPFITTPINIAKASIERSPLGFIGGKYDDEQMGKALIGSVISLIGAGAAMSGRVTWMPPKNEKERKAFYDSGRTPLSVEIGGKYIPAWYFGPYAISFMLPEAFRYQMQENPQRLTSGNIAAISKAILASGRLITEQTPMAGIKDLTNIMTGRETVSSKILARPVSQMIPFVGGLRFIANVIDPIYRKSTGFIDELKKSIPGLTKDLEAYKKLDGTPSTRTLSSQYFPYSINPKDPRADIEFRDIQEKNNRRLEIKEYQRRNKERMGE